MSQQTPTGFKDLLNSMMKKRWWITALVLGGFVVIMGAIFAAIFEQSAISGEWKNFYFYYLVLLSVLMVRLLTIGSVIQIRTRC